MAGQVSQLAYGRFWDETTGSILDTQEIAERIFTSMSMCDMEDLIVQMDRVATALEGINEKTAALITWDELLEDLENTLGIGSFLYKLADWIMSLFPTIKLKMDMTPIVHSLWEYYTFKRHVLSALNTIAANLQNLALVQGASGLLDFTKGVLQGWQALAFQALDYITGDGDLFYESVIEPLINKGIPDSEGGTGGDNPDLDISLRNTTNIFLGETAMAITINNNLCGGCGTCAQCTQAILEGGGVGTSQDAPSITLPSGGGGIPPTGFANWTTYAEYHCKAANVLVLNLAELCAQLAGLRWYDFSQYSVFDEVAYQILQVLNATSDAIGDGIQGVLEYMSSNATLLVWPPPERVPATAILFDELRLLLLDDRDAIVCDLYGAVDTVAAREVLTNAIDAALADLGYPAADEAIARATIIPILSNTWLNRLFAKDTAIDGYVDESAASCEGCGCPSRVVTSGLPEQHGTITAQDANSADVTSGVVDTTHWVIVTWCGSDTQLDDLSFSGFTAANPYGIRIYNRVGLLLYAGHAEPTWPIADVATLQLKSTTAFTVEIDFTDS